jgi:2-polyprenyl-3-methyl-5-hydroxy-6-metoxy-1,4-benzoquinol methylase
MPDTRLLWRHRVLLRRYPAKGRRVLDVGCGDGELAIAFAEAGAMVTGYDPSVETIAAARARAGEPGPRFTTEPPAPGGFDLVLCTEVLEHVPDDRAFALQLISWLRPGGRVVGTTPVGSHFWDPDHKRTYDEQSLRDALGAAGAVTLRRYYRTPLRNLLPWRQRGAAVFLFEIRRLA